MLPYEREQRILRHELGKRLLELRGGDVEPMVDKLVGHHRDGDLVALRDHGLEVLLYVEDSAGLIEGRLARYELDRDGFLRTLESNYWRGDLEGWLVEHRDELDWVHYEWREEN